MTNSRRLLLLSLSVLAQLLLAGCSSVRSEPIVVTREVTRIVVATPTPSIEPVVVEVTRLVTVVVIATPAPEGGEEMGTSTPASVATEQGNGQETVTPVPDSPTSVPTSEAQPSVVVLDSKAQLAALSKVAEGLPQDIHTLRLTMNLSAPVEVMVSDQQLIDEELTSLVRDELAEYDIQGNYIIDISLDDLMQEKWVIDAFGGIVGLDDEEVVELRQSGEQIWQRATGGEWSSRELTADDVLRPLGNSLAAIDANGNALNLSDLVVDALQPLLLAASEEQSESTQSYGWTTVSDASATEDSFLEMRREQRLSSSHNLAALTLSFANLGLSEFVSPTELTNGIQERYTSQKAWLISQSRLVDHGQVEVQGKGGVEVTYLTLQRRIETTIILKTDNSFEYLPSETTVARPPFFPPNIGGEKGGAGNR